uniref:(California timema) hypothetical protein n=1 Tax=Timema californicum TaxID=61474 RepID=A0A7R9PBN0_TIMCA|nr:unnamed protein product [Timema californicum]
MSQRDLSEVEPEGTSQLPASSKALFMDKVRQSNSACQSGDYPTAVALYTDALQLDPTNHILYSNRSAAHVKMGQFAQALQDAIRARELNLKWPKEHNRGLERGKGRGTLQMHLPDRTSGVDLEGCRTCWMALPSYTLVLECDITGMIPEVIASSGRVEPSSFPAGCGSSSEQTVGWSAARSQLFL